MGLEMGEAGGWVCVSVELILERHHCAEWYRLGIDFSNLGNYFGCGGLLGGHILTIFTSHGLMTRADSLEFKWRRSFQKWMERFIIHMKAVHSLMGWKFWRGVGVQNVKKKHAMHVNQMQAVFISTSAPIVLENHFVLTVFLYRFFSCRLDQWPQLITQHICSMHHFCKNLCDSAALCLFQQIFIYLCNHFFTLMTRGFM